MLSKQNDNLHFQEPEVKFISEIEHIRNEVKRKALGLLSLVGLDDLVACQMKQEAKKGKVY